jgi:NAD(P)-dependent dehydrogenase (short-subunit alcohol dehydrogenase family)
VVVVVGGAVDGGISNAIVKRTASSGDTVAILDIDEDGAQRVVRELESDAGVAAAFGCDVADRRAVFDTMKRIVADLGPPWGLVHCPAVSPPGLAEEIEEEDWRRGLDVMLSGALWCAQAVFPHMRDHGGGRIVTIGSEVSERPTDGVSIAYIAAKGAMRSLTKGLAWQWGKYGITVNMLWPYAETAMSRKFTAERAHPGQAQISQNALGRVGDPAGDIAPIVGFLLSDESGFMTGATVSANGGRVMP